jgi:ABC-type branched-subunit amino acid transport system ATPase component
MVVAVVSTVALGFAVHAIADAVWPRGTSGSVTSGGYLTGAIKDWVLLPTHANRLAIYGYLAPIVLVVTIVQLKGWWRVAVVPPTLVRPSSGENLLIRHPPSPATSLWRASDRADGDPAAGLFGTAKVEIVCWRPCAAENVRSLRQPQVILDLDFHVDQAEIVSVIGPNGAGKTTLFNLVTGVYELDEGEILFEGESIVGLPPNKITRKGIARTFQTLRLFLNMTVKENVMAAAYGHTRAGVIRSVLRTPGMRREEREIAKLAEDRLSFFGQRLMGYRWNQPAYSLSYANRRRLEIARAMATTPGSSFSTSGGG